MTDEPAMIGPSPSERGLPAIPADPAVHARRVARQWSDVCESYVRKRMRELGIPEDKIGASDLEHGIRKAAFMPHETGGGGNTPDGRLNIDSGILNPGLFKHLGLEASEAYAKAPLRVRVDAGIAHEFEEARGGGDHQYAFEHAPDTKLPISRAARELARKIREGERGIARS